MKLGRVIAYGVPWGLATVEGGIIYLLMHQHGRLLLRQDDLAERLEQTERAVLELTGQLAEVRQAAQAVPAPVVAAPSQRAGLPIGSDAPDFTLPDLDGQPRTLKEFLGSPLLVAFFNLQCGFCLQMAPQLGQLPAESPRVLLISRGDPQEHRRLAQEHHWRCDVVLEPGWEVAQAYHASGTPTGYLLDAQGHIASDFAMGAPSLLALLAPGAQAVAAALPERNSQPVLLPLARTGGCGCGQTAQASGSGGCGCQQEVAQQHAVA